MKLCTLHLFEISDYLTGQISDISDTSVVWSKDCCMVYIMLFALKTFEWSADQRLCLDSKFVISRPVRQALLDLVQQALLDLVQQALLDLKQYRGITIEKKTLREEVYYRLLPSSYS